MKKILHFQLTLHSSYQSSVYLRLGSDNMEYYECVINIFTIIIVVLHDILVCHHYLAAKNVSATVKQDIVGLHTTS